MSLVNETQPTWSWYQTIRKVTSFYCFILCVYIEYALLSKLCFSTGRLLRVLEVCIWLMLTLVWLLVIVHGNNPFGKPVTIFGLGTYIANKWILPKIELDKPHLKCGYAAFVLAVKYVTFYVTFYDATIFWEIMLLSIDVLKYETNHDYRYTSSLYTSRNSRKNTDNANEELQNELSYYYASPPYMFSKHERARTDNASRLHQLDAVLTHCLIPLGNLLTLCVIQFLNNLWQKCHGVFKSFRRLFTNKLLLFKYCCWNIIHATIFVVIVVTINKLCEMDYIQNFIDDLGKPVEVRSKPVTRDEHVKMHMYQGEGVILPSYYLKWNGNVLGNKVYKEFRSLSVSDSGIYEFLGCKNLTDVDQDGIMHEHMPNRDTIADIRVRCKQANINLTVKSEDTAYIYPHYRGQYYKIVYPFSTAYTNQELSVKYTVNNVSVHDLCFSNFIYCSFESWLRTKLVEEDRVRIITLNSSGLMFVPHIIELNVCMCNAMYGLHRLTIYQQISGNDFEEIQYALKLYVVPDNAKDIFTDEAVRYFNTYISDSVKLSIPLLSTPVEINVVKIFNEICFFLLCVLCPGILYAIGICFKWYSSNVYNPITYNILTGRWVENLSSLQPPSFAGIENVAHFQYDVFLSSCDSERDRHFIWNVLLPFLERNGRQSVCFPHRDHAHLGGANLLNTYLSAVSQSRKFVVVLSRDYLEDDTCNKLQLERSILPLMTFGDRRREVLIIIRLDSSEVPMQVRQWPDVHVLDWTEADRNTFYEARLRELLNR